MSTENSNELETPLVADLDGTLIRSDLLLESFLLLIKLNPLYLLLIPLWLLRGKAVLKGEIARRVNLNPAALPYSAGLIAWLQAQKAQGREIWLCTASDRKPAEALAKHLGFFDGVLASDGQINLAGHSKAAELVRRFGERGFDYCGNHTVDLAVWKHARAAIVVNGSGGLEGKVRAAGIEVAQVFPATGDGLKKAIKAMRPHQWAKNGLIFVPVAAAHQLGNSTVLLQSLVAFVAFSLCASSVYLLNDMLDLEADRQHHTKCKRPFAAGDVSLLFGLVAAPLLLIAAAALAACLPLRFLAVLGAYYVATLAYSFALKRMVMIDVLALAGLYTVRIVAGASATDIPLSFWLLMFSVFMFLSLAMVKRYAELFTMRRQGKLKAQGRGYQVEDLHLLQSLGAASGYISVLVLALYVNSPDISAMYHHPRYVWMLVPVMLYWISRVWTQTYRGHMHDDPLVFALKDRISLITGAVVAAILALAV